MPNFCLYGLRTTCIPSCWQHNHFGTWRFPFNSHILPTPALFIKPKNTSMTTLYTFWRGTSQMWKAVFMRVWAPNICPKPTPTIHYQLTFFIQEYDIDKSYPRQTYFGAIYTYKIVTHTAIELMSSNWWPHSVHTCGHDRKSKLLRRLWQ